jgi:hypothetical protein
MNRTLDEHRKENPRIGRDRIPEMRMMLAEAVRMEAVTGDPDWDHYLAYLEAALMATTRLLDVELARLRDPRFVNSEMIQVCKSAIAALEARIGTLKEIQSLPKFLKERGAMARESIANLEKGA